MSDYKMCSLWLEAFTEKGDGLDKQRKLLEIAYDDFRSRVSLLLQHIQRDLPDLTVHDITHVDSLWRVASQIAGPGYPLNASEAFVLGGAFLLHDAAQCIAAYPGGVDEVREKIEWKDAAAQMGVDGNAINRGTPEFKRILFETLRVLHPSQALKLPFASWTDGSGNVLNLLPHDDFRDAFGHLIGRAAESHWFDHGQLEDFSHVVATAPSVLSPADWTVNLLKISVILRVADAAHIDQLRAPRLLMALNQVQGVSRDHWQSQARMNSPKCEVGTSELRFSSNPFPAAEQAAWWIAFETAQMVERELSAADHLLRENHLPRLQAREVAKISSPEAFSKIVPTEGWHPIDASLKISDVRMVVSRFGGSELYGENPRLALREILQNSRDAIFACRAVEALGEDEGSIVVELECRDGEDWLHVTDTGIGMSRYVLTNVLLDFGKSLWRDPEVRRELPGLASKKFDPIGRFGIGFFSIFMLGDTVRVTTRRYKSSARDLENDWVLEILQGIESRPILRRPSSDEALNRHGTRVSVKLKDKEKLLGKMWSVSDMRTVLTTPGKVWTLNQTLGSLAPALEIDLYTIENKAQRIKTISAGDWRYVDNAKLVERISPGISIVDKDSAEYKGFDFAIRNLENIVDEQGRIVGRAVVNKPPGFVMSVAGIISVGGLWGGSIQNISGIVEGQDAQPLNRKSATPKLTANSLINWANKLAVGFRAKGELNPEASMTLAALGAPIDNLFVAHSVAVDYYPSDFLNVIANEEYVIILDDNYRLSYDPDGDGVSKHDFDRKFRYGSNVFWVASTLTPNSFIHPAEWPESLVGKPKKPEDNLISAISQIWPNKVDFYQTWVEVGTVDGEPISRMGRIIYKNKTASEKFFKLRDF